MELSQAGFAPSAIAGTSMGAIVGAFYATGQDPDYMVKLLATMDLSSFFGVPGSYRAVVEEVVAKSLVEMVRRRPWWELNTARTSRFLAFLRLFTKGKKFEELGTPLTVVACDVASGEEVRISEGPVYLGVGASAALPGLLGPVRWQGRLLIDGGVVNNLPIDAVANNADCVVAVDVSDPVSLGTLLAFGFLFAHSRYNLPRPLCGAVRTHAGTTGGKAHPHPAGVRRDRYFGFLEASCGCGGWSGRDAPHNFGAP
jgi:predicted acylesterase/phospholipase RssA